MQRLEKVIYMMNQNHVHYKKDSNLYLPRVGSYYSLLGQFYYKQQHFENAHKCLEAALSVWQEAGIDAKEQGYGTTLELFH